MAKNSDTFYRLIPNEEFFTSPLTLRLSIIPFSGHISVYASCRSGVVTKDNSIWKISPVGSEGSVLDISSLSEADNGCPISNPVIVLAVHGDSAATYSIKASILNDTIIDTIVPGQASIGSLTYNSFEYYYLSLSTQSYQDITISLSSLSGDTDLYISDSWISRPYLKENTVKSYIYSSNNIGNDAINIKHEKIQYLCANKDSCYFIIGVFGNGNSVEKSQFSVLVTYKDSTITLSNAIPLRYHVEKNQIEYFKYSLSQENLDVMISITPLYGDPGMIILDSYYLFYCMLKDVFISVINHHPTRSNFTWALLKQGHETLTIQYSEISKHCNLSPTEDRHCDIFIGVFGWSNSSFSIISSVNEGFLSPILLLDQQPQSGYVDSNSYVYYKYLISAYGKNFNSSSFVTNLKLVLTPSDGGDMDMFICFSPVSSAERCEPGRNRYDYKSSSWSNAVEIITVTYGMQYFCDNCYVFIAVNGFAKGHYVLQATSNGIVKVMADRPVGGRVDKEFYSYFSIYNPLDFAELSFTLTMVSYEYCSLYSLVIYFYRSPVMQICIFQPVLPLLQWSYRQERKRPGGVLILEMMYSRLLTKIHIIVRVVNISLQSMDIKTQHSLS